MPTDSAAWNAAGTTVAFFAAALVVGCLVLPWATPPVEAGPASALRASAEALVAAGGAAIINLVAGGCLAPVSGGIGETKKSHVAVHAVTLFFVAVALGVLLLIGSVARPIPLRGALYLTIQGLSVIAVALAVLSLWFNVAC